MISLYFLYVSVDCVVDNTYVFIRSYFMQGYNVPSNLAEIFSLLKKQSSMVEG